MTASSLRAKRSNPGSGAVSGLLRRFAPRNDGAVVASESEAIQAVVRFLDCFVANAPRNDGSVIASEASNPGSGAVSGLLRRFAPRNNRFVIASEAGRTSGI
jgi:hypothetical protein